MSIVSVVFYEHFASVSVNVPEVFPSISAVSFLYNLPRLLVWCQSNVKISVPLLPLFQKVLYEILFNKPNYLKHSPGKYILDD